MISFIKRHEGWLNYIVFGSSSVVLFIYTPFSVMQRLAQSVFFNFLGPGAGAAANLTVATVGGAISVVGVNGIARVALYVHEHHQTQLIHPQPTPDLAVLPAGIVAPTNTPRSTRFEYSPVSPRDEELEIESRPSIQSN